MILQTRYNPKLTDAFQNSKDFYQFQNSKLNPPKQRLDQLSLSQRQKNNQLKDSTESSSHQYSRNYKFETKNPQIFSNQQEYSQISFLKHQQSLQDETPTKNTYPLQHTSSNMQYVQESESQKKMLPPLKLVAEKVKFQEKNEQKEKHEKYEKHETKQNQQDSPNLKQSVARKHTIRLQQCGGSDQKVDPDNSILQMGRTSSTPFLQKKQDLNLTSRSGTPAHDNSPKSLAKTRKKLQTKVGTQQIINKQIQNRKQAQTTGQPIKILENLERKSIIKKKKYINSALQQQQQLQKEKLTQRMTSYRCFLNKINFTNNICISSIQKMEIPAYLVYIGKGNNSALIRTLFRQRWWWQEIETLEVGKANMVWTQLKQNMYLEQLYQFQQQDLTNISNNESFIGSREETIADTSDSDMEIKQKGSFQALNKKSQKQNKRPNNFYALKRIMNMNDLNKLMNYMEEYNNQDSQIIFSDCSEKLLKDIKGITTLQKTESKIYRMHNHMEDNWHLGNKKALFYNMKHYFQVIKEDYTKYIPITFHIQKGTTDEQYQKFVDYFNRRIEEIKEFEKVKYFENKLYDRKDRKKLPMNLWIIKPGELTNRGNGITVCSDLNEINKLINEEILDGRQRTYIVQQYIDNPMLYNKRKFDIRCYMLLTSQNGIFKGYWYADGYIRTSSKEFTTKSLNKYIHLTNDAVQSKDDDYGKYESGNKISFIEFQRYLDSNYPQQKFNFFIDIYPKMKNVALDLIKASYGKIDPHRRTNSFELYGLDFMIDDAFKLWLIEANTNPCLELSCPILSKIIPSMVENLFRIAVDPIFPPPFFEEWPQNKKLFIPDNVLENNKFDLIFDEAVEKKSMIALFRDAKIEQEIFEIEEEEEEENEEKE